jgi:5-methylcytosine-specific restriction endonuclease McrA
VVGLAVCVQCEVTFTSGQPKLARFCSKHCRWLAQPRLPCTDCGGPTGWRARSDVTTATCNACRRLRPGFRLKNQRAAGIKQEWVCEGCGAQCSRPAVKGQRPKWCQTCRTMKANRWTKVTPTTRRAIYERDAWTCWLCLEVVDEELIGTSSLWRPSLDHVVPRSRGGTDSPTNLRLAHNWCNSARSDGRAYSEVDFRATA